MKHTVYLPAPVERLLSAILALDHAEHPGTSPKASPVIADALVAYAAQRTIRHLKDHGIPPKTKAKLEELAKALDARDANA